MWDYAKHSANVKNAGGPNAYDQKIYRRGKKAGYKLGHKAGERSGAIKGSLGSLAVYATVTFIAKYHHEIHCLGVQAKASIKEKLDSLKISKDVTLDNGNQPVSSISEIEEKTEN